MVQTCDGLVAFCQAFLDRNAASDVAISDKDVIEFFSEWSFTRILSAFTQGGLDAAGISAVVESLRRLLDAPMGAQVLRDAVPYLCMACGSPAQPLRRLAAQQLGRVLRPSPVSDAAQQHAVCTQLVLLLSDADTGVAADAEAALVAWVLQHGGGAAAAQALLLPSQPLGAVLQDLASGKAPTVEAASAPGQAPGQPPVQADAATCQVRVLALALHIVAHGGQEMEAVLHKSGLLEPILSAASNAKADPLSAMSCLAQLQQVATTSSSKSLPLLLHDQLLPQLEPLLADSLLGPSAMTVSAALLRTSLDAQAASLAPPPDLASHALIQAFKAALDEAGDAPPDAEAAAFEALGVLAHSRRGAEALLLCPGTGPLVARMLMVRALRSAPTPDLRLAALHAAATLAGAERVHELGERRAALMGEQAEVLLREATYAACSGSSVHTPSEAVQALLSSPFAEQRAAVYRFISAMAVRPWFAAEVVRNAAVLARITSAASEAGYGAAQVGEAARVQGPQWRHAAVESLWLTAKQVAAEDAGSNGAEGAAHAAALAAAFSSLTLSVKGGPHGASLKGVPAGVHEYQVATLP